MSVILSEPPESELASAKHNAELIRAWWRARGREVVVEIERVHASRGSGRVDTWAAVVKTPIGCGGKR